LLFVLKGHFPILKKEVQKMEIQFMKGVNDGAKTSRVVALNKGLNVHREIKLAQYNSNGALKCNQNISNGMY